ncbi:hypothetical protein [Flammeovirga kamogawensis]|uniref:Porin family protein n=1 Tax=Flammeovirga kamogawensis TaxID=373891 RepID=A0ABX8GXV7_9BACT|nr:hypothetical protein [Flammeovirga kamogawensis]MBB6458874.1 hypothetical protein [Flammeovirga kamogawensis]QWG08455.1 hypothetical protein KM029_05830 [Flammeovirga kamogawensis]TRX66751.1 hypothetical protein EO216_00885 [Flammeovirga kamogawensis]
MKKILLLLTFCLSVHLGFAQSHRTLNLIEKTNYTLIGGNIGGAYYSGAYANQAFTTIDLGSIRPSLTGYIQTKFAKRWHFRFQGSWVQIGSKDNLSTSENFGKTAFRTNIFDFTPMMIFDIGVNKKNKSRGAYKNRKSNHWNWYLMAGTGLFAAKVNNYIEEQANGNIGSSHYKVGGTLNGGLGVRYALKERWILNAEALFRMSTTNDLDGKSSQLLPVDFYVTGQIGVAYRIPGRRFMR